MPVRVPTDVHAQVNRLAALRGQQPGQLLAKAWEEYLANHREAFAVDLEQAARIVRDGTLDDLAAFTSRNAGERAREAAERLRSA